MKKMIISLLLIFLFLAGILVFANKAIAQEKPTLLYIYMQGCSACRQFDSNFSAAQSKFSQKFNFVKEDINSSQRAKRLNVTETPSVFIIGKNGYQKIEWSCLSQQSCFEQRLQDYK